jgi:DNA-directed RNA polymerase subunit beta'
MAAQSIGEPGTQLTMRVRHFGGIVISDVTQGLPRVEELFETRTPKIVSPIAETSGKVTVLEDTEKEVYSVKITSQNKDSSIKEQEFVIPMSQKLKVKDGDLVVSGASLSEGYLDVDDVLAIRGLRAAQIYLLDEIQKVYESQGITIHDKHFETIIRKMSDKVIIEDEGDTAFIRDEVVSKIRFEEENKRILVKGGKPATGKISILGITRAAIHTDSWLSAASFEQTTNVLSNAAIKGQVDSLLGLKENVIIGRLIPVTAELIEKYYGKFVNKYADNQPTSEKGQEEKK